MPEGAGRERSNGEGWKTDFVPRAPARNEPLHPHQTAGNRNGSSDGWSQRDPPFCGSIFFGRCPWTAGYWGIQARTRQVRGAHAVRSLLRGSHLSVFCWRSWAFSRCSSIPQVFGLSESRPFRTSTLCSRQISVTTWMGTPSHHDGFHHFEFWLRWLDQQSQYEVCEQCPAEAPELESRGTPTSRCTT